MTSIDPVIDKLLFEKYTKKLDIDYLDSDLCFLLMNWTRK